MSSKISVVIVMGAAVWENGRASNAMRRRIAGALRSAEGKPNAIFLVSGGVGKHPPSEAEVMAGLLRDEGISPDRILLDDKSKDTLESVRNCAKILRALPGWGEVIVCSDIYHIPRCRWLFKLVGIATRPGRVASGRSQNKIWRWAYYYLREMAALPWDTLLTFVTSAA